MRNFIAIILFSLLSISVWAAGNDGFMVAVDPMYLISNSTNNGQTTNSNRLLVDGLLGYRFEVGLMLGFLYGYDTTNTSTSTTSSTDTYSSYGPTLGFDDGNLFLWYTYFLGSTDNFSSSSGSLSYTSGSGYQIALGYRFSLGSGWGIGPELAYRNLTYTQVQPNGGSQTSTNFTYTTLMPYINICYSFNGN